MSAWHDGGIIKAINELCRPSFMQPQNFITIRYYAPAPVGEAGALGGHRHPSFVRPSVRLMSRTSALTRKPKGLGRRNFAPLVTCDSHTDIKVKRSKVKVTGSISAPQRNVPIFRKRIKLRPSNLAPKWAWPGVRDPILKFWEHSQYFANGKS